MRLPVVMMLLLVLPCVWASYGEGDYGMGAYGTDPAQEELVERSSGGGSVREHSECVFDSQCEGRCVAGVCEELEEVEKQDIELDVAPTVLPEIDEIEQPSPLPAAPETPQAYRPTLGWFGIIGITLSVGWYAWTYKN